MINMDVDNLPNTPRRLTHLPTLRDLYVLMG